MTMQSVWAGRIGGRHELAGAVAILPRRRRIVAALIFGNAAAPALWLLQVVAASALNSPDCAGSGGAATALVAIDGIAILTAIAGGIVSSLCWQALRQPARGPAFGGSIPESRLRLMAVWGTLSSLWFLGAIGFNAMQSAFVHAC